MSIDMLLKSHLKTLKLPTILQEYARAALVLSHKNGHLKQPVEESVVQTEQVKDSPGSNEFALGYKRFRYTQIDPDRHLHSLAIGNGKPVRF